jgi:O-methyltransferase
MVDELLKKYNPISEQVDINELRTIMSKLELVLINNVHGDVVEMGCYVGTTSLFITRLLNKLGSDKDFHVYDSFEGLPEKSNQDLSPVGTQFTKGQLSASKKTFILNYKKALLPLPVMHKKWFHDLTEDDIPKNISFAFLDGDYYESIRSCIAIIEERLTPGSIVIVDDYNNESLPGAKKAVDQWLQYKKYKLVINHSLAIIKII